MTVKKDNAEIAVDFHTIHLNPKEGIDLIPSEDNPTKLKSGISETEIGMEKISVEASIFSIYPNPISGSTIIQYYVEKPCLVSIEIVDANGRTVKTVKDGQQLAGSYRLRLISSEINPGIYFCMVNIGDTRITKKIVVQ